jgi:molybdenum cofactor guanylyltransferase
MTRCAALTVVLLAGGPATRLPGKLSLDVGGEPMLARSFRRLTEEGWPCVISVRTPLHKPLVDSLPSGADYAVVADDVADGGPLGGLCNAARAVRTPLLFAAAADLPNLSAAFASALLAAYHAALPRTPAAVLPTWPDGHVEPLAALYDRDALIRGAAAALASGKRKVTAALDGTDVVAYPVGADEEATLLNVNTPQDYEKLSALKERAAT